MFLKEIAVLIREHLSTEKAAKTIAPVEPPTLSTRTAAVP
jgi:hypothetical protein